MNSYIYALLFLATAVAISVLPHGEPVAKKAAKAETSKIIFRSTDGGQTWQDISAGLPENLQMEGFRGDSLFATDKGLFIKTQNGLYHNSPSATSPLWTKETLTKLQDASNNSGILQTKYWGVNLTTADKASIWSPMFDISEMPRGGTFFETASGAIFVGTSKGYHKTADRGKTWKQVHSGALVGHLAESNGVLTAISDRKIIRSTDDGDTWEATTSADAIAWDVKPIKGGFVALTAPTESATRRLSTSYDGGKTWQIVESSAKTKDFIENTWRNWNNRPDMPIYTSSISQIGEYLFGVHRNGISRSADNGKTWKFLLPAVPDKVFGLFRAGKVLYAVSTKGGC